MLPTYIALPVIAASLFVGAALPPLVIALRGTPMVGVACGLGLLVLLAAALYRSRYEGYLLVAGLGCFFFSGLAGRWIAARTAWTSAVGTLLVIGGVLGALALVNLVQQRRTR